MKEKVVFACGTPLQIMNAIVLKESRFTSNIADLYVCNDFKTADVLVKTLQETKLFRNVYLINKYKEYPRGIQKIVTLMRMLFPYLTLKKYAKDKKINREHYNSIIFSFINAFSITVYGMAKAEKYIQLEDGMGTYVGDILNDYTSGLFKKIIAKTRYKNIAQPKQIAIYNEKMYRGDVEVLKMENNFSESLRKKIEKLYGYNENYLYQNNKYIYLTQPLQEAIGYDCDNQERINKVLEKYKDKLLVRMHPRDIEQNYETFTRDTFKNLWELECIRQIDDTHVLLGTFSTAQLMPKILGDKEPYIIFLYKVVFQAGKNKNWNEWDKFVELFKSFYRKPEKIYVPESINDFECILWNVLPKEKIYEQKE